MAYCTDLGLREENFICDCCGGTNVQIFCTCMFVVYSVFWLVLVGGITFYLIQKARGIAGVRQINKSSKKIGMDGSLFCPNRLKSLDDWQYFEVILLWIACELFSRMMFLTTGIVALSKNSPSAVPYSYQVWTQTWPFMFTALCIINILKYKLHLYYSFK